ncbi:MAG: MoxR family ATPase [Alphaproteobacteria bacterium]
MTLSPLPAADNAMMQELSQTAAKLHDAEAQLRATIFGQDTVIRLSLAAILAGGHVLLIGMPGVAKTKLVLALGQVLGLQSKRIQCTPDLMPADILGTEVLEEGDYGKRSFRFIAGPVFCQLLMADEINRASPRTQSALLQAMQEHAVTVAGGTRPLPEPFHVLATQNPVDQEGTYPLPEAQLDRFLLQIDMPYPDRVAERAMLIATTSGSEQTLTQCLSPEILRQAQQLVRRLPIGDKIIDGILHLVRQARPETTTDDFIRQHVTWGPGPRAAQALSLAARARAMLDGRVSPSMDDVLALLPAVLQHRMALNFAARAEGVTVAAIFDRLRQSIVP